jgi:predicted dehydrogenase
MVFERGGLDAKRRFLQTKRAASHFLAIHFKFVPARQSYIEVHYNILKIDRKLLSPDISRIAQSQQQSMDTKSKQAASGLATRREFIKKTATAAAAVATASAFTAKSWGRVVGANDRISVAVIGVGVGIGQNHLLNIHKNASLNNTIVSGASDLFTVRRDWAKDKEHTDLKDADVVIDYRKVLERNDIDAVVIATHDIWHAQISLDALDAGKHVYCEKPMTRYLDEAFKVYDKAKANPKLIYQIGSQGCSAGGWKKCSDLVRDGKIGTLIWSQGYYCRNSIKGEWNEAPFNLDKDNDSPKNIDWETWQGKVKNKVAFDADHFHRWRKYYPYCAGLLGDLAPHRMHPLMLASGNPEFPFRVTSLGTQNVHADKEASDAEPRQIPEHQQILAEFPSGYLISLTCSTVNAHSPGFVLYGHKAILNVADGGNKVDLIPEAKFGDDIDPQSFDGMQIEDIRVHETNFFDSIRDKATPNAPVDLAIKVQTALSLAEMSNRLNVVCLFDEKTRTIKTGEGKKLDAITYGTLPES